MRITNQNPGHDNWRILYDPCPMCNAEVNGFDITYAYKDIGYESGGLYMTGNIVTFSPCQCKFYDNQLTDYQIFRTDSPVKYNKAVLERAIRLDAKKSGTSPAARASGGVRL